MVEHQNFLQQVESSTKLEF